MPLTQTSLLRADQVPLPVAPAATLLSIDGDPVPAGSYPRFAVGQESGVALGLNRSNRRGEATSQDGAGGYGFVAGAGNEYGIVEDGGTTSNVLLDTGRATIGGPVEAAAQSGVIALADGQNYLWVTSAGTVTAQLNTLAAPTAACAYRGRVTVAAGVRTAIDVAGVLWRRGPHLWRFTADAGPPADSPPASLQFFSETLTGLYWWSGTRYFLVGNSALQLTAESVPLNTTAYIPAGYQSQTFGPAFQVRGLLRVRGHFRVRGWN